MFTKNVNFFFAKKRQFNRGQITRRVESKKAKKKRVEFLWPSPTSQKNFGRPLAKILNEDCSRMMKDEYCFFFLSSML